MTCDFQQCGVFTCVDSDEPPQPPFKLRNSKWCSVSSVRVIEIQATSKGSDQTARMRSWSELLLVAQTTLLEISCCGSYRESYMRLHVLLKLIKELGKYRNHILHTNTRHRGEEPHNGNSHKISGRQLK